MGEMILRGCAARSPQNEDSEGAVALFDLFGVDIHIRAEVQELLRHLRHVLFGSEAVALAVRDLGAETQTEKIN